MYLLNQELIYYAHEHQIADDQREIAQWSLAQQFSTDFQTLLLEKGFKKACEQFSIQADQTTKIATQLTIETTESGRLDIDSKETPGASQHTFVQTGPQKE